MYYTYDRIETKITAIPSCERRTCRCKVAYVGIVHGDSSVLISVAWWHHVLWRGDGSEEVAAGVKVDGCRLSMRTVNLGPYLY